MFYSEILPIRKKEFEVNTALLSVYGGKRLPETYRWVLWPEERFQSGSRMNPEA